MALKFVSLAATICVLSGCQLFNSKSQLRTSTSENNDKNLADTIALGMSYPYERESGSYLFVNGTPYPYESLGKDPLTDGTLRVGSKVIQVDTFLNELNKTKSRTSPNL